MNEKELIEKVRLAIDPKFQDWVLFEHGTYVIVDQADTMKDVGTEALNIMSAFGPVHPEPRPVISL